MIKTLFTVLYPDENILYFDEDSRNVVFFFFNGVNLDDTNEQG